MTRQSRLRWVSWDKTMPFRRGKATVTFSVGMPWRVCMDALGWKTIKQWDMLMWKAMINGDLIRKSAWPNILSFDRSGWGEVIYFWAQEIVHSRSSILPPAAQTQSTITSNSTRDLRAMDECGQSIDKCLCKKNPVDSRLISPIQKMVHQSSSTRNKNNWKFRVYIYISTFIQKNTNP